MEINVIAKPNSGKQEIEKKGEVYVVRLKSAPENNKANLELIKLLKRYFGKEVRIKRGFSSRKKAIEIAE